MTNAHKFVAVHGIEKAKAVLEGAPDWSRYYSTVDGEYYLIELNAVNLKQLKQVVESFENIEFYGGFEEVKFKIRRAELNGWLCISVAHEDGFAEWYLEGAIKAIADYELVGSYKSSNDQAISHSCISDFQKKEKQNDLSIKQENQCEVLDMTDVSGNCEVRNG